MKKYKKAIILGGSKGIGKTISLKLKKNCREVISCSRKLIDTSDLNSVKNFLKKHKSTDILVLNTGGPPNIEINKIDEKTWYKYFNQLFLSYFLILKKIRINKNGYIFYISSTIIKEPNLNLILSSTLRTAFSSFFKSYSKHVLTKKISCINIAPGPTKTSRAVKLTKNYKKYKKNLPLGDLCNPNEIGDFVKFVTEKKIKYLTGSTIYFEGNLLKSFL